MNRAEQVAEAMLKACWVGHLTFNDYLRMADAAITTLGLTSEQGRMDWSTATGHQCTCDSDDLVDEFHTCERGKHRDETFAATRWVGPWQLIESNEP